MTRLNLLIVVSVIATSSALPDDASSQVPDGFEAVRLTREDWGFSVPHINNLGEVVYHGWDPASNVANVFKFSNGGILQLTDDTTFDLRPAISNLSMMAWESAPGPNGPFAMVTDYTPGPIHGDYPPQGSIDMNDAGDVVWRSEVIEGMREIFIYTHSEGTVQQISHNGVFSQTPRMNNSRQVVWSAKDSSQNPWQSKIMLYSDGVVTELTEGAGQRGSPDINDNGIVVWREGGVGVVLWDGKETTLVIENGGTPRINNVGDIFFQFQEEGEEGSDPCLLKDGFTFHLPDFAMASAKANINSWAECAWRGLDLETGFQDMLLLRRIAPKGDADHDCHVDFVDARVLQVCFTGADQGPEGGLLAECIRFDFDEDGDVDVLDYEAFLGAFTGPNEMIPGCVP